MADRTTEPTPTTTPAARYWAASRRLFAAAVVGVSVSAATGFWVMTGRAPAPGDPDSTAAAGATTAQTPLVGGVPLFSTWPKAQPEVVLAITGQTFGYLSPCGCSRPQKGGLERRANLIEQLKQKGWPVVGLDLGDLTATKGLARQNQIKYRTAMKTLAALGYAAVGVGEEEFHQSFYTLLAEYTLPNTNKRPIVLAGNLVSVQRGPDGQAVLVNPREAAFNAGPKDRPMVEAFEIIAAKDHPTIAVVGAVGPDVGQRVEKLDSQFGFESSAEAIKKALTAIGKHPAKPEVKVLLYAGSLDRAKAAAQAFPQFQLIVCQSEEAEPPQYPTVVNEGKTLIVQVGQKGQNVGVVGAFRTKAGFDLKYQLVPLGEEYLTPEDPKAEKANIALQYLEEYAAEVKKQDMLAAARAKPMQHAAQIKNPGAKLTYVGAQKCAQCHAAEFAVWAGSKHSHAYEALETAKRPGFRQYDPECVKCHVTGFDYVGGFDNETATAFLKGNQCENCHGPGSGHADQPNNKALYEDLLPWRAVAPAGATLPNRVFLEEMSKKKPLERNGVAIAPAQQQMVNAVSAMCTKCHDELNDPHFDFYEYFPKIYHSGLKANGLPLGAK